jgi:hypothetical protein
MPASKIHIFNAAKNAAKKAIPAGKTCECPTKIQGFYSKTCALQQLVKQANPR